MTIIIFRPVECFASPVLVASQGPNECLFQALDMAGEVVVETRHTHLSDVLRQVALRMDVEQLHHARVIKYEVEVL